MTYSEGRTLDQQARAASDDEWLKDDDLLDSDSLDLDTGSQDNEDDEEGAEDPEMDEDTEETSGQHEAFVEGDLVRTAGAEVDEEVIYKELQTSNSRERALKRTNNMLRRVVSVVTSPLFSAANIFSPLQYADNHHLKNLTDEDQIKDLIPEDEGGRFDLIPDKRGSIIDLGGGVFRDSKSRQVYKKVKPGEKSEAKGEGKSVVHVGDSTKKAELKSALIKKRESKRKPAETETAGDEQ